MKKLTTREWELYKFLKEKAIESPTHWVTHEEICNALPEFFELNHKAVKKVCCSNIQMSVMRINESQQLEKVILFKHQCYKLATDDSEVLEMMKKYDLKIQRIAKRKKELQFKLRANQQTRFLSSRGDEITESSKARPYFETYLEKEVQ